MSRHGQRHIMDGPAGPLELALHVPEQTPRGIALIAHPHSEKGGTMDNKVVQTLAKSFFAMNYAVVRFNFRGVGGSAGVFDEGAGETEDALAVLEFARDQFGALPIVLGGFSFGSFVQTQVYDRVHQRLPIERMILVGPAVRRFHIGNVPPETLVIHGEEDEIVPFADVLAWARPQHLPIVVFPGCGHFFHGRLVQLQQVVTRCWQ
jgi:hypothetical protein